MQVFIDDDKATSGRRAATDGADLLRKALADRGQANIIVATGASQFDMLAVFEAVTNAVAHRDYSMGGSKVRLRLFDDRLELYTPGQLPNTMTPESLPYRQSSRNEVVTSLLARCPVEGDELGTHRSHIMDKRGEGVPIILSRSEQLSRRMPEYRLLDESELLLTIYAAEV